MNDATLSAIVAADRLALSEVTEGKELLHRRLTVFYGYFALLGALAAIGGWTRRVLVDVEPRMLVFVLRLQMAHALILCAIFVALRFRVREPRLVRGLDVVATVSTSVTAAVTLSVLPRALSVDVSVVSFFILRAALLPSKPWLATLVAAVSAIPFTIGLASMYRRALVPDPEQATWAALRAMVAGIAGVYVVSKTIYGLRRVAERAVQLGQYVVHEKIGQGGMGVVYRASHAMLKRPTAVKLIAPDRAGETATARFEREVSAASRLSHPNNVAIYDFGRTRGGVFYYAMESDVGCRPRRRAHNELLVCTQHHARRATERQSSNWAEWLAPRG
jgi:eukaryotic-like serine/threonine-protein kinase